MNEMKNKHPQHLMLNWSNDTTITVTDAKLGELIRSKADIEINPILAYAVLAIASKIPKLIRISLHGIHENSMKTVD